MPERLDPETRLAKLKALGLSEKYSALVALANAEREADEEIAKLEAVRAAEIDRKRLAETPIIVPWAATPGASDDICLFCPDRRPHRFGSITINGQEYTPALPNRTIGFVEAALRPTMPANIGPGCSYGSVRNAVFLLDALGSADATSVVMRLASDATALLLCIWRAYSHTQAPVQKSLTALVYSQLVQHGHPPGGNSYIPNGERHEWQSVEAEAERIWAIVTADAPVVAEIDLDSDQRRATSEQVIAQLQRQSARADRDAARALIVEATEDAKFADAVKAASAAQ